MQGHALANHGHWPTASRTRWPAQNGPRWQPPAVQIKIEIGNPELRAKLKGMKEFVSYKLTTTSVGALTTGGRSPRSHTDPP